jgi:transposase
MPKRHLSDMHEQGFQLYLQGRSFDQIRTELKVAKSTVERWSKGNESRKEKPWAGRASEIRAKASTAIDKRAADQIGKLCLDLELLRADVMAELKSVKFRSKEGAIGSVKSITELLAKMGPRQRLTSEELTEIWNVLLTDPDVGRELHKAAVSDRIMKKIDQILVFG